MPSVARNHVPDRPRTPLSGRSGARRRLSSITRRSAVLGFTVAATLLVAPSNPAHAEPGSGPWDPLLPMVLSAGAPGDPLAMATASLQATAMAAQTTMDLGRKFLGSLGIISPAANPASTLSANRVNGKQAIEYVIRRAGSQMGVPYSWGGGSLTGPSLGIDSGADTVGFDCSGLTRYAFAGVGVLLPRFSGAQYDAGRKVPPSQAKRGDLLFWGSGGGQHEALYLGGGQMLEAQQTGVPVQISPVRTDGMTPYVTRIIES